MMERSIQKKAAVSYIGAGGGKNLPKNLLRITWMLPKRQGDIDCDLFSFLPFWS